MFFGYFFFSQFSFSTDLDLVGYFPAVFILFLFFLLFNWQNVLAFVYKRYIYLVKFTVATLTVRTIVINNTMNRLFRYIPCPSNWKNIYSLLRSMFSICRVFWTMCDEIWISRITFKAKCSTHLVHSNIKQSMQAVGPGEMFCNKNLVIRNLFVSGSGFKNYIFSILKRFQFSYNLQTQVIETQACNMVRIGAFCVWIQNFAQNINPKEWSGISNMKICEQTSATTCRIYSHPCLLI